VIVVAGMSLFALAALTLRELVGSVAVLRSGGAEEEQDIVNPYIVMGFSVAGLFFDFVSLWAFRRSHRRHRSGGDMNMWSALLHVLADLLRSVTTLALSFAILLWQHDSVVLDAWASLLVGATVLVGVAAGLARWLRALARCALPH